MCLPKPFIPLLGPAAGAQDPRIPCSSNPELPVCAPLDPGGQGHCVGKAWARELVSACWRAGRSGGRKELPPPHAAAFSRPSPRSPAILN